MKIPLPESEVSRIVCVSLGVVSLHLAVLWLVQVGAQQIAPVMPTFLVQLPSLPQSNSGPPTPPATAAQLPSRKTTSIARNDKRIAPMPQAPMRITADTTALPARADTGVTTAESTPDPIATTIAAPDKSDGSAIRTNPASDSAASNLQLPSSVADYLSNPAPVYPSISQRLGEHGKVVIRVFITKEGSARQAEIHQSSGFDRLDQAALRAVLSWRYVPGQRAGVPQDMWFDVPINFALK